MNTRPRFVRSFAVVFGALVLSLAACSSDPAEPVAANLTSSEAVSPQAQPVPSQGSAIDPGDTEPTDTERSDTEPSDPESLRTRIEYGNESEQFAWLQLPSGSAPDTGFPVVVLVHGGFWRQQFGADLMDGLADDLAVRGYASWNIEYRRVGGAGGWPMTGADVAAAIEHLAAVANDRPIDLERVVSVGHSAGGHLGLWALGQQEQVHLRGSVGLGAVVDLAYFREAQGLLGGTVDEVPDVYEDAAPVLDPERVVLIQGGADSIVPQASLRVAEEASIPIVVIDGEDHFDLIDPSSDSWSAAVAAIDAFVS